MQYISKPNLLVNMTRKKLCGFQRFVVLGKMVHTQALASSSFAGILPLSLYIGIHFEIHGKQ